MIRNNTEVQMCGNALQKQKQNFILVPKRDTKKQGCPSLFQNMMWASKKKKKEKKCNNIILWLLKEFYQ